MFLKRIESYGFKSFANRVSIEFDTGMSAIVGPNGSGKSNVVDATRWVLGEQSAKTLRGGNMQDVIFKGSASKKQLGFAEVTLVMDNEDHKLPLDFTEVSVTRRLYRNGESIYLINGQKVRLQDVTNLFMDSGIGKESFSIIGQGRIDEILNSKPVDRRAIFEEAAGVLKYKTRKEQSLRRLEKTHENLQRVSDVIAELELQVGPLGKQAQAAKSYLEQKEELESLEISLLAYEIKLLSKEYDSLQTQLNKMSMKLAEQVIISEKEIKLQQQLEEDITSLDDAVATAQEQLLLVTKDAEHAKGAQQMHAQKTEHLGETIEQLDSDVLILTKKLEQVEKLEQNSTKVDFKLKINQAEAQKAEAYQKMSAKLTKLETLKQQKMDKLSAFQRTNSRHQTLQEINDSLTNLFQGVREIIKGSKRSELEGINGTIVDLIEVEQKYTKAIETALANALQFIITNTQKDAEKAISYLKKQKLGKATFLPLDIIKGQTLTAEQYNKLKAEAGFIGLASELLTYNKRYEDVFLQQLGQTIIAQTLEQANMIAKKTNFRFRIVTLAGEVVHRGGSLTGGETKNEKTGLLSQKKEIETLANIKHELEQELAQIEEAITQNMFATEDVKMQFEAAVENLQSIVQKQHVFEHQLTQMLAQKQDIHEQIIQLNERKQKNEAELEQIDKAASQLGTSYTKFDQKRSEIIAQINGLRTTRIKTDTQRNDSLKRNRAADLEDKSLQKAYQKLQIEQNTAEIKAGNKVSRLQETYQRSYESVKDLDIAQPYETVEKRVFELKTAIDKIGTVNLGAIDEYVRVSERFEYLTDQKADLDEAEDNLLMIIKEMDHEMQERFAQTFKTIQENFSQTFKKLFGGGTAELRLEQKGEFLTSGIDIYTQPPGKKNQNLSLLSGGERALTAIALLFAILKTKPVPFCILDEVEAALDDANVDRFAHYLKVFSKDTQFIVVTHRKGTMECADVLYGVTMEEPGISKILSVRLQEANKLIE
ncbi:MAG: chromosome segregation SMC family protein [Culicoidibacterales bacterium]